MKIMINKVILSDRYILIILTGIVLAAVFAFITFVSTNSLERKNEKLRKQFKELQTLKEELVNIKYIVDSKEKKIGLTDVKSVVSALEQTLNSLGLEAKVIKSLGKKKIKEFTEEDAELEIEKIDLNKIVNLLYKIENSPVPMKIKTTTIRTTFENPDIFVLNMTASLISKSR